LPHRNGSAKRASVAAGEDIMTTMMHAALAALATAAVIGLPGGQAQTIRLPDTLMLIAYDTGSSGFNVAVAVGKAFKDKGGTDVRVLPAGNDVARLAPQRPIARRSPRWASAPISRRRACSSSP
jgi:ABC-type thiamine transport system substrate-binding protein